MPTTIGKPKADFDDNKMRRCLTCNDLFMSQHRGIRICNKHKKAEMKGGLGAKRRPAFMAQFVMAKL